MKIISFLILLSIFSFGSLTLKSQSISAEKAKIAAINYYNYKLTNGNKLKQISDTDISLVNNEEIDLYYIINLNEKGFVIISAQSNCYPILAYSTENNFSETNIPINVQALLNGYNEQILDAVKTDKKADYKTKEAWNNILNCSIPKTRGKSIEALTTSLWDQTTPYNLFCPEDENGSNGHVITGCPATAMAQLMYYYRYPKNGVGSNSYYLYPYDTISANFENAYYDYNAMTNVSNSSNYEEVAELNFHAGVAINTFYGPNLSGVYDMQTVVDGLEDHFAYSENAQLIFKTSYTQDEWESMLRNDLDMQMPVIYCAVDQSAGGGHTWICDGYDTDEYFHMNFGWGGSYDGYYYLDNISIPGYTFNSQHQMIIGAFPADSNYPDFCTGTTNLTSLDGTFTDGSGPFNYENNTSCSWLIDTQTSEDSISSISLTIDKFNTEVSNDKLTIYDGNSENSPIIAVLSANDVGETYTSIGNKMFITFQTNATTTDAGWMLSYESNFPEYCDGMEELTEESGIISDGSGIFNYSSNAICMWKIKPELASSVTANFLSFDTEENVDFLKLYDGDMLIGNYSGSEIPPEVTAESGELFIFFSTNSNNNFDGWEIEYSSLGVNIQETTSTDCTFNVFPNPSKGIVNIEFDHKTTANTIIVMHNAFGKQMLENKVKLTEKPVEIKIDCSSFSPGIYMVTMKNETQIFTKKVILQ
jgi:hypothetical protein